MGKQIFQAYLSREDASSDASTRFDLPASPWQLLDALDKAKARLAANVSFDLTMELLLLTIQENS